MSSFTKPFNVIVHNLSLEEKPFEIAEEFEFYSEWIKDFIVFIPKGYRSDFASVPRIFWNIIPPVGRYSKASVVHDWLLDNRDKHNLTSHKINLIFKEAMKISGVNWTYRNLIFISVEVYWVIKEKLLKIK